MSIRIPISAFSNSHLETIGRQVEVKQQPKKSHPKPFLWNPVIIYPYRYDKEYIWLPFHYTRHTLGMDMRPGRSEFRESRGLFCGTLRPEQKEIEEEAMSHLNRQGSCLLSVYPGFGKTIISIRLACKIRLKTLIIINKVILLRQWEDSIRQFVKAPARVQMLEPKNTSVDPDADFYLVNALNVYKMDLSELSIGLVIVDECHLIMTSVFSYALTFLTPRYMIGLSATPYRSDGFDRLLDLYFGTDRIHRKLYREHEVLVIQTGYRLDFEEKNGKIVWNSLLHSQMVHEERNRTILRLIQKHHDRNILVLCKRVHHVHLLNKELEQNEIATSTLIGSQSRFDPDCRVLLASIQKAGTGFSFPKLDMLILACDCEEYYIQYMCRVMRTPEVVPIIVDLVDEHPSLKRHFRTRKKVYEEAGGTVRYLSVDEV